MKQKLFTTRFKRCLAYLTLFLTPIILLFTNKIKLTEKERFEFFISSFFKLTPIAFLINSAFNWHAENESFLYGLYAVMFINAFIGVLTHRKLKSFDIGEFFKSTLITVVVVFGVYFSLDQIDNSIPDGFLSVAFTSSIQIITLLYPIAKIMRNSFILTNGKFPPEFLIEKLYNYERDGNIKEFLEIIKKEE
ncbi:hypothetical protein SAMN05443634_105147 [Chishuiella changwenlii]|nr:hypothetical protein [Chishuiella changwenlii]SHL02010.1 hypothetical protein SAMN05443634_105147 [Chishuiella changwenlii]